MIEKEVQAYIKVITLTMNLQQRQLRGELRH